MRLIDADALQEKMHAECDRVAATAHFKMRALSVQIKHAWTALLEETPTIDSVEVVRCGQCVNREISPINPQRMYCHGLDVSLPTNLDFYCARGAKMDAEAHDVDK